MAEAKDRLAVFVAWKDIRNPAAGGAERLLHEMARRWAASGRPVVVLAPGFPGAPTEETTDGVQIRRVGRSILSFPRLSGVYRRWYRARTEVLIDVFTCRASGTVRARGPRVRALWVNHIQDRMWFHQTVFPGVPRGLMPLLGPVGYGAEKVQLRSLARTTEGPVLTISESTRDELLRYGFGPGRIRILPIGIAMEPLADGPRGEPKEARFTVLLWGPRRSKRPLETLRAFARFQRGHPDAALWIAGWGTEDERLAAWADRNGVRSVRVWGRVSEALKRSLMQKAHVLCTSPVKEGWGLVVTEANAMGTPAVGYDVPGLREALAAGGGRASAPKPDALAAELDAVYRLWSETPEAYDALRRRALGSARAFRLDEMYARFRDALG